MLRPPRMQGSRFTFARDGAGPGAPARSGVELAAAADVGAQFGQATGPPVCEEARNGADLDAGTGLRDRCDRLPDPLEVHIGRPSPTCCQAQWTPAAASRGHPRGEPGAFEDVGLRAQSPRAAVAALRAQADPELDGGETELDRASEAPDAEPGGGYRLFQLILLSEHRLRRQQSFGDSGDRCTRPPRNAALGPHRPAPEALATLGGRCCWNAAGRWNIPPCARDEY